MSPPRLEDEECLYWSEDPYITHLLRYIRTGVEDSPEIEIQLSFDF